STSRAACASTPPGPAPPSRARSTSRCRRECASSSRASMPSEAHAAESSPPKSMPPVRVRTMNAVEHLDRAALDAGVGHIRGAPKDNGRVELIVRRPEVEAREVLSEAVLDTSAGLVGDCWRTRGSSSTADGEANPDAQLTLMNVRSASLVAGDGARRQLAG